MGEIQRLNITLPKKLVKKSRVLIDEGLYQNFSELVRESLKNELRIDQVLIEKKMALDRIFKEEKGISTKHLSQEELLEQIRRTRDSIWKDKSNEWFKSK